MKLPPHQLEATAAFYRDVLQLPVESLETGYGVDLGPIRLWLDRCPQFAQAQVWLSIESNDAALAADHLKCHGVVRCDDVEPLPQGFPGFWIASPAGIVHIVDGTPRERDAS